MKLVKCAYCDNLISDMSFSITCDKHLRGPVKIL